jgi:hypothetical protein
MASRWRGVGTWVGLAVSAAAVAWLALRYDWRSAGHAMASAGLDWLLPVAPLMVVNFVVRAARWRGLFPDPIRPRLPGAFSAMMAGYLFNNLLPARAGELVRVHMVGRGEQLPRSAALGTVVVERTLDLLVLLVLLSLVLLGQPLPGWTAYAGKVVAALAAATLAAILLLGWKGEQLVGVGAARIPFLPAGARARLEVSGRAFVGGVSAVLRGPHLARFVAWTACIWALELGVVWLVAQAFALPLGALNVLFVMLAVALGTMVPASPGYVGTFEFFGLSALSLLGVEGGGALAFVVTLHAVLLIGSSAVGAASLAWSGWPRLPAAAGP